MEVFVRNLLIGRDTGKLYALIYEKELVGIKLSEITIANGQGDGTLSFQANDIMGHGVALQDIVGIGICLEGGIYIASCWEDAYAEAITRAEFEAKGEERQGDADGFLQEEETKSQLVAEEEEKRSLKEQECQDAEVESSCIAGMMTYEKIDLSQIRDLPSPNWHFATNSFLVHGFWNYGYLVLKKEMEEGKEKLSLGVPGIFEKPEAVMAVLFGFPHFQAISKKVKDVPMNQPSELAVNEKNQEAEVGDFGCWFVNLKM